LDAWLPEDKPLRVSSSAFSVSKGSAFLLSMRKTGFLDDDDVFALFLVGGDVGGDLIRLLALRLDIETIKPMNKEHWLQKW